MDVQLNIRCSEETATAIKARAESAGMKLGAFLERLIAGYSPDSAMIATDSSGIAELNNRLNALESRLLALERQGITSVVSLDDSALCVVYETVNTPDSSLIPSDSSGEFNQDLAAFKAAVADYWNSGMKGYGPIATALKNAGYRNSNGNLYTRESVKKALVKAGLVEKA
jgi:hypothetical protein